MRDRRLPLAPESAAPAAESAAPAAESAAPAPESAAPATESAAPAAETLGIETHDTATAPARRAPSRGTSTSGGADSDARAAGRRTRALRALLSGPRRVPTAAWICALIAFVNAACWSVISPSFQLPDEPAHFAYVEHLAETGHLPSSNGESYPLAEQVALFYLRQTQVRFSQENRPIASRAEQRQLERWLALPFSRGEPGDAGVAASQPPLYYALETIPYKLGSGGTLLDRLALMRLFSALFGGLTALFAFLFLRESLPGTPWAWTVGGLGVALTPVLGMMSGAVNPDALLFAISAALFFCLARAFRRGLTRGTALAVGALIGAGCLTKLTFLGLVPGAAIGVTAAAIRQARVSGGKAYRSLGLAFMAAVLPACAYLVDDALSSHVTLHVLSGATTFSGPHRSIAYALAYIWQLYLPRLPGMAPTFHGISGTQIWFEQLVGKYGWLDTTFPAWVVEVALIPVASIAVLFVRALVVNRGALRARRVEVMAFLVMVLGVLTEIGVSEYVHRIPNEYLQLRYVLPLVALMGAVLALAARGAGRRWGPIAGTLIVLLVLAHDLFSQLLVISRYYG